MFKSFISYTFYLVTGDRTGGKFAQAKLVAKFAAGVVDTGGKFAAGVVELPPVSLTPVVNL